MKNLRKTENPSEILQILKEIISLREKVMIWQNIGGKRNIHHCYFSKIDEDNHLVHINFESNYTINLSQNATLYIKGDFQNILFKENIRIEEDAKVVLNIPKELRVHEHRSHHRINFEFNKNSPKILFSRQDSNSFKEFDGILKDLSVRGMGFYLPAGKVKLKVGERINVAKLGVVDFLQAISGKLIYQDPFIFKYGDKHLKFYRVGVQFDFPIRDKILSRV